MMGKASAAAHRKPDAEIHSEEKKDTIRKKKRGVGYVAPSAVMLRTPNGRNKK